METDWLFSPEQLDNTPSRRSGMEADVELLYRNHAASLIQDMGQRLGVSQLTINTAIAYMHRFYMVHSFSKFPKSIISQATLFLAAKVEEEPQWLENIIHVAHARLKPQEPPLDPKSNTYHQKAQELVGLETLVLETLGFDITVEHPHPHVVRCFQMVHASRDLVQTSDYLATNSLHLTTFCLQHKPTVVACVCIHLACKWSSWEIPVSADGKHWWEYLDNTVTLELLEELTQTFRQALEKMPGLVKQIRDMAAQVAKELKTEKPPLASMEDDSDDDSSSEDEMPRMRSVVIKVSSSERRGGLKQTELPSNKDKPRKQHHHRRRRYTKHGHSSHHYTKDRHSGNQHSHLYSVSRSGREVTDVAFSLSHGASDTASSSSSRKRRHPNDHHLHSKRPRPNDHHLHSKRRHPNDHLHHHI